jgi:hypothetical protein
MFPTWRVPCGGRGKSPRLAECRAAVRPGREHSKPARSVTLDPHRAAAPVNARSPRTNGAPSLARAGSDGMDMSQPAGRIPLLWPRKEF